VAASFARLYYRNAINQAPFAIDCPEASDYARAHKAELEGKRLSSTPTGGDECIGEKIFRFAPMSGKTKGIFAIGGLAPYTREKLEQQ